MGFKMCWGAHHTLTGFETLELILSPQQLLHLREMTSDYLKEL